MKDTSNSPFGEKVSGFFRTSAKKLKNYLIRFVSLMNRHRIMTGIAAFILLMVSVLFGVANHYLNKINYDDGVVSTVTTRLTVSTTEEAVLPVSTAGGAKIFSDGSYVTAELTAVLADGTSIFKNTSVIFQDGKYFKKSSIKVDTDGYFTIGKTKLHISKIVLNQDGTVSYKDNSPLSLKFTNQKLIDSNATVKTTGKPVETTAPAVTQIVTEVTQPEEEDDNIQQVIEQAKTDSSSGKVLKDNDVQIEQNIKNTKIWYSDDIINILVMGIDNGSQNYPYGRSDSMIVASVNKKTKKVKLVSLARSAYVSIKGYPNTRLNHAHGYGGAALAMDTVERNYRIRIDNYISTNFDSFKKLIDQVGGVSVTLTKKEAAAMKQKLKSEGYTYKGAGSYNLNGETALYYVRLRKIDNDRQRTQRQRNVLTSIANKINGMNFFEMNALLNKILPLITTNLSKFQIVSQLANVSAYIANGFEQDVLPNKIVPLTLRDGYEVAIVDWKHEVEYAHNLFYSGVTPKYKGE